MSSSLTLGTSSAAAILARHATRRNAGVPTVSVLIGPVGVAGKAWRRWAADHRQKVVAAEWNAFPIGEWLRAVAEQIDLPVQAVHRLAQRAGRDPAEFLIAWRAKTTADRDQFWKVLPPDTDDELLRMLTTIGTQGGSPCSVAEALNELGERVVPMIVRLIRSAIWPSILMVSDSIDDFSAVGPVAAEWAMRVPAVPIAVAVPDVVWDEFIATAPESRAKTLLKEGEFAVPVIDSNTVEQTLREAGAAASGAASLAAHGADVSLLESAAAVVRATAAPPPTEAEDDRARSAAERFLFEFLESLPETAGRFELNAALDFRFGLRPAEVDLLCRGPRIAVEVDGYFHFLAPDAYRRDRTKDWELQRRGFVVLRFLAEDVIAQLDIIRDRILDALTSTPLGESP